MKPYLDEEIDDNLDDINLDDIKTASFYSEENSNKIENETDLNKKKINDIIDELFSVDKESTKDDLEDDIEDDENDNDNDKKDVNKSKEQSEGTKNDDKIEKDNIKLDYTWFPLDKKWTVKLMSDKFVEKDCTGDGNCQFKSIETALTNAGYKMDHTKLRKIIGRYINKLPNSEFYNILQNYRIEKQNGEFKGKWNPFYVKTKRQFINNIVTSGFHFEGDSITLGLLSKAMGIDFIIFNSSYNIIDTSDHDNLNDKLIILYYIRSDNTGHYKTIGLNIGNNKIQTIFKRSKLPREIDILLDKHTFLLEHIKELYGGYTKKSDIKLNKILHDIETKLEFKLSNSDKKKIMVILRNWLQNLDFFENTRKIKI